MQLLLVIVTSILSISVYAKQSAVDKLQLSTGLSMGIVEADDTRARVLGFNLGVRAEDKFNSYTDFFFDISGTFEAGSNQSVGNIAEFKPNQGINLNNAGLLIVPFDFLSLTVGALDQGKFLSPLLITSTAFAAVEERFDFGNFYLRAQQSIPANNQLTQRVGTVDDATPYFGMEMLGMQFGKKTFFKLEVGHFSYKDLSSATANISREMGNSVSGLNEASKYNYGFEGTNSMMQFQHAFDSGLVLSLWGQYLYNNEAPDGRNTGELINLGIGSKQMMIYAEAFRNESDSSPSFYNSKWYGHNNMQGNSVVMSVNNNSYSMDFKYTKANVIENTLVQSDMELITFNLVKFYEI